MGKSNTFANDVLKLVFNGTPIANLADNAATAPLTNLWVALHTTSPGVGGSQTTNEAAYPSYARIGVARTTSGWTAASAQSTSPVAAINFPTSTGTPNETEGFFSVGTANAGAGKILCIGTLSPPIAVNGAGIIPQMTTATTIVES